MRTDHGFERVIFFDFEFTAPSGEQPRPICVVSRGLDRGDSTSTWLDGETTEAPFCMDRGTLFVAYYASAEIGCHLALGWPIPPLVLDLYPEFRCMTNGRPTPCGAGLLGALAYWNCAICDRQNSIKAGIFDTRGESIWRDSGDNP